MDRIGEIKGAGDWIEAFQRATAQLAGEDSIDPLRF